MDTGMLTWDHDIWDILDPSTAPSMPPISMAEMVVPHPPGGCATSQKQDKRHGEQDQYPREAYLYDPGLAAQAAPPPYYFSQPKVAMDQAMRKRKGSMIDDSMSAYSNDSNDDDDDDRLSQFSRSDVENRKYARQNHSEIEKRRRDKMNSYITELSMMVPMCNAMNRKLDKLTVLRMAVQHMKTLRGSGDAPMEVSHKPSFLSDDELKHLILKAADGFLFVVGCDRGRILYVSESVRNFLHYTQSDLIGQSLFDFLHPKDITKVKEQLLSSDLSPRERFIDAKTMLPVKTEVPQKLSRLCSGARRAFFCRMRTGVKSELQSGVKMERDSDMDNCHRRRKTDRRNYSVIHCTGYLKSWPPAKMGLEEDADESNDSCNLSCLVAIGKLQPPFKPQTVPDGSRINIRPTEFLSRHAMDGKFTYVDQRATAILGYLPQELLETSVYEYYHHEDLQHLSETHRKILRTKGSIESLPYRFKAKDSSFVHLKTKAFSFRNPWTKEVEYLVATNTVLPTQEVTSSGQSMDPDISLSIEDDIECRGDDSDMPSSTMRPSKSYAVAGSSGGIKLGAGKIGRQIAEEVFELQKDSSPYSAESSHQMSPPSFSNSSKALQKVSQSQSEASVPASLPVNPVSIAPVRSRSQGHGHSSPLNGLTVRLPGQINIPHREDSLLSGMVEDGALSEESSGNDGNDEAAMAVIMSLLEADAGLGGPVDFSDLPWPL